MRTELTHTVQVMGTPELPIASRWRFVLNGIEKLVHVERGCELPLRRGSIFFSKDNLWVDRAVFREVFLRRCYATDYGGASVVDVGAHKGYFGAFALNEGAASIRSYEPEPQNFEFLCRAAETAAADWRAVQAAVGARSERGQLRISPESWSHALVRQHNLRRGRSPGGLLGVEVLAAEDVLAEVVGRGRRVVVKIDVEGLEAELVRAVPRQVWRGVDELFVEVHDVLPAARAEIVPYAEAAGLRLVSDMLNVLRFRR